MRSGAGGRGYIEWLRDDQRARTFVPTDVMAEIAATTIRPAMSRIFENLSAGLVGKQSCKQFRQFHHALHDLV